MPELPEVECVRRSLERHVLGRRITSVRVNRPDIVNGRATPDTLLAGSRVASLLRHGKQLALVGDRGMCVVIHLGMSGQLCIVERPRKNAAPDLPPHTHVVWRLESGTLLRFTDPRRFGGLWTFDSQNTLASERWASLGPDALKITPAALHRQLARTARGLKATLLDQAVVAGLGNIYVDELLFNARLHPLCPSNTLGIEQARSLVRRMRTLLNNAVQQGGSTLRDYVNADNARGNQQERHRVYGRAGLRCKRRACRSIIASYQIAGRTTAWCPSCQARPT